MRFLGLVIWVVLASSGFAQNLAKAKAEFAVQDKALNVVYADLKKSLPKILFEKVQEDQRRWVEHRDYIATWESEAQQKKPADDPAYWTTARWLTEARVVLLKAWKGVGEAGEWNGVYRDGYGGELSMLEKDGILYFTLSVVRGPTHHAGIVGGLAQLNGASARFTAQAPGSERHTWLTFLNNRKRDGRVELIGENTQPFHGARAYFEGLYLRVSVLDAKAAAEVVQEAAKLDADHRKVKGK